MMFYNIYSYIFVTLVMFVRLYEQRLTPTSPCPDVFKYDSDGNELYGSVEVEKLPTENFWLLDITMSYEPVKYRREMELLEDTENIRFKMHFPIPSIIPKVTKIVYKNKIICNGPPANGTVIKTITRRHFYRSKTIGDNISTKGVETAPEDWFINSQDVGYYKRDEDLGEDIENSNGKKSPTPIAIGCGMNKNKLNPLVLHGESTDKGDWPWLVALYKKEVHMLNFLCGGSLISNRHVITAAHCVVQRSSQLVNINSFLVKVGAYDIDNWEDENVQTFNVKQIRFPPTFDIRKFLETDIAIIVINTVIFSNYVIPVCLWNEDIDTAKIIGENGTVVGWGISENWPTVTPKPRKAVVPIVSTHTCRGDHIDFHRFTSNVTLCAGTKDGNGPCNGDSGGGLFLWRNSRWTLRGIVSTSLVSQHSPKSCNLYNYIIYADCAKYMSWIKKILNS